MERARYIRLLKFFEGFVLTIEFQSSLLSSLLCEARHVAGKLSISGKVTYCSQDSWIFSGTIRDNILFGCEFDQVCASDSSAKRKVAATLIGWIGCFQEKYRKALEISALNNDIAQFPRGDAVLVGDRGTSLSGIVDYISSLAIFNHLLLN